MPAVTDVAGLNSVSARILANAAAAMAGMVTAPPVDLGESRPVVAATMFGVTTPAVTAAREELERRGYEVLVFHATGTGGRSMEALVEAGFVAGVLDLTTTELADELVGGVLSAGPDRLEAAGRRGRAAGGLARRARHGQLRPARHRAGAVRRPEPLRAQPERHADAHHARGVRGARPAARAPSCPPPPARSRCSCPCAASRRSPARAAPSTTPPPTRRCCAGLRETLAPSVEVHELDAHINDPAFAVAMAARLDELLGGAR